MTSFDSPDFKNTEKQEVKETSDSKIHKELEKNGGNIFTGMNLMAEKEIEATKKSLSQDERNNPEYTDKFTETHEVFAIETQKILLGEWSSEEKIQALELAFKKFQETIGSIKGTKEAQDAQRAIKQGENIQKNERKNEQWNQKFKEVLLQNIQESIEKNLQTQRLIAKELWNQEQKYAQEEAKNSIRSTSVFGPPGNIEKEKSKV